MTWWCNNFIGARNNKPSVSYWKQISWKVLFLSLLLLEIPKIL